MRIVLMSDSHSLHNHVSVPDGDVFVHCGDFCGRSTMADVAVFGDWVSNLPHKHKIVVAGNHDVSFQKERYAATKWLGDNVTYLQDSGCEIDGLNFYGSPWTPVFYKWAFMLNPGLELQDKWKLIPENTDVLVTHGPPFGILDRNNQKEPCGDKDLLVRVNAVTPALHAFGHIHESSGALVQDGTLFVNAAVLDNRYKLRSECRVVDLIRGQNAKLVTHYKGKF